MAAGGGSGRGSSALESSLDRKFQGVSNTMESIQSLSTWCIENKKHNAVIVRYWMKWLRKSDAPHRLNLFYLANDVIQNCKRKNAIVYRSTFAEVLPEAALLVKDAKVRKSVERIFSIWEERNVYPEELITELKTSLVKKEPAVSAPVNPKSALKSKIVAEFAPQAFIEQLSAYQRSVEEVELKEKQLSALRVDVCSTETLKRLKDKAGGKKFSKDFEDGNAKLEEFVSFLETQVCSGPKLIDALENADVFYEMQYKEVKIVANAYKTFANRVNNLKRKLDVLKASLPDPEDSPIPSPSEDAPSPTGSESPFHGMGRAEGDPDIDGQAMDEPEGGASPLSSASPPTHSADNRDVQDMELSEEEETESANIIVEERREKPAPAESSPAPVSRASEAPAAKQVTPPVSASPARTPGTPGTPSHPLPVNLANVDLGKISSILSSLTSVMKSTGVSPVSRPSPGTPGTPTPHGAVLKPPPPAAGPPANPLASILSRVDITPESILSALSKTQGQTTGLQGLSSLLHSVAGNSSHNAGAAGGVPNSGKERPAHPAGANQAPRGHSGPSQSSPTPTPAPADAAAASSSSSSSSSGPAGKSAPSASAKHKLPARSSYRSARDSERERERAKEREREPPVPAAPTSSSSSSSSSSPSSLEMKIHKFLQGNPGFSALNLNIPILGGAGGGTGSPSLPVAQGNSCPDFGHLRLPPPADNVDGTPVRDERGATPTQDEMMDKPAGVETMSLLSKILSPGSSSTPGSSTRSPLSAAAPGNPGRAGTVCSSSGSSAPAALPPPSSSSSSSSSYKAFGQGGRDLSPTAYRGGDSWEKPDFSEALPAAGSFYPRDASGFGEAEDEYPGFGGPPTSALFNLDKKPAKSILKSSAGGGGRAPEDHRRKSGVSSSSSSSAAVSAAASSPHAAPADSLTAAPHKPRERTKEGYPFGEGGGAAQPNARAGARGPDAKQPPSPAPAPPPAAGTELKALPKGEREAERDPEAPPAEGEHYHRIETLVSSASAELRPDGDGGARGAPIQTLGYSNRRVSGERIQTVESIRVIGKGVRGHSHPRESAPPGRGGPATWYEAPGDPYRDGHALAHPHPHSHSQMPLSAPPSQPPPPSELPGLGSPVGPLPPQLLPHPPSSAPPGVPGQFPFEDRPLLPYPDLPPPPAAFFNSHPPPPPPPIPQPPPPPRDFVMAMPPQAPGGPPSAVLVGGVMVPVDRVLPPFPPRGEGGGPAANSTGGGGGGGGSSASAPPAPGVPFPPQHRHPPPSPAQEGPPSVPPLLPPSQHPRPGTVKEHFAPRPPLHHPGAPGPPPPLLGRMREAPSPPPPSTSSSSSSSSSSIPAQPPSPTRAAAPSLPPRSPIEPPGQQQQQQGPPPNPPPCSSPSPSPQPPRGHPGPPRLSPPASKPLARLAPPAPPAAPQRPFFRGPRPDFQPRHYRPPPPHFHDRDPSFRGKRPYPAFGGPGGGGGGNPFFVPKRPFLPPRY